MTILSGRVALVTGGSRGIGAAIAGALANAGATVGINYLAHDKEATAVVDSIRSRGGQAMMFRGDVRNREAMTEIVAQIEKEAGAISILIHNAGAAIRPTRFEETTWDHFGEHFGIAVGGAFNTVQSCLPGMKARRQGAIVFVASAAAHSSPPPKWSGYITAKAALLGLMRSLAVELGPLGIRVNAVSPGLTSTELTAFVPERMKQVVAQQVPLQRLATPDEIAAAVVFLASDAAAYLSGVTVPIAGGSLLL